MTRKLSTYFVLSLLVFAFLATTIFAAGSPNERNHNRVIVGSMPKAKLAGAETVINYVDPNSSQSLGYGGTAGAHRLDAGLQDQPGH